MPPSLVKALEATSALENNQLSEVQRLVNQHKTYKTLYYEKILPQAFTTGNYYVIYIF